MSLQDSELTAGFQIRRAVLKDMERVGEIARQAWQRIHASAAEIMGEEMHAVLCANWEDEKTEAVRRHLEAHPEWFRVVVAAETERVVAFLTFSIDRKKSLGRITNNAVAPEAQGKGLGTAMYRYALDCFRSEGLRFACVGTGLDEGHAPARRAYEKAGFNIAQPQVTYYRYL
ncbi:MAG: GNAT family N-acetyltransferase [Gemmatimonadota bacterium]|nr:GNAT family N-acetyltransferase [Gemmatimonadota bacterium]